jgi:hypothetical protein
MKKLFIAVLVAMVFIGCSTPKIALDGEGFREMPVKGRNGFLIKQKLAIGEFTTSSVKRSWTRGSSSRSGLSIGNPTDPYYENIISMEYTKRKQTVNFTIADASKNNSEVRCVTKFSSDELIVGNNPNSLLNIGIDLLRGITSSNTFYAQIFINGQSKPWQLLLDNIAMQDKPGKYTGVVALDKENYYSLVPVNKMLDKNGQPRKILFGSIGLELRNKMDKTVATVSFIDNGKVYMNTTDKNEEFLLANICAALLLQQEIGG